MAKTIPLTQGFVCIVDDADYEWINARKWKASPEGPTCVYANRTVHGPNGRSSQERMHRIIAGAKEGELVDHINGDTLDNRRSNLRIADASHNSCNRKSVRGSSSSFKGITWHRGVRKWQAAIKAHGRQHYLGVFASEVDAAKAYDAAAREMHGDFARLNFPGSVA